jgi:hypothetical protein
VNCCFWLICEQTLARTDDLWHSSPLPGSMLTTLFPWSRSIADRQPLAFACAPRDGFAQYEFFVSRLKCWEACRLPGGPRVKVRVKVLE